MPCVMVEVVWRTRFQITSIITHNSTISTLPQPSLTPQPSPHHLNDHSQLHHLHTTSIITHTLQPSPHCLNHHSRHHLHTTSIITHNTISALPQPSLTTPSPRYLNHHSGPPHYLNHHSCSTLPQPSLIWMDIDMAQGLTPDDMKLLEGRKGRTCR